MKGGKQILIRYSCLTLAGILAILLGPFEFPSVEAFVSSSISTSKSVQHVRVASRTRTAAGSSLRMASTPGTLFTDPFAKLTSKIVETEQTVQSIERTAVETSAKETLGVLDRINEVFDGITADAVNALPTETVQNIVSSAISAANDVASSLDATVTGNAVLAPVYLIVKTKLAELSPELTSELGSLPPAVALVASAGITYGLITAVLSFGKPPPPRKPYPLGRYDAASARAYFDTRLGDVIARGVEVGALSAKFGLGLLSDYLG